MRDVKVDRRDPTDLYEQVAADIRRAIADGEAKPGERLPPAKDLAAVLGVNTNTVLRALRTAPRRGTARIPPRARHLRRWDARTRGRRPAGQGTRRLRPPPRLPPRRADRDHRRRRLTTPAAPGAGEEPCCSGATRSPLSRGRADEVVPHRPEREVEIENPPSGFLASLWADGLKPSRPPSQYRDVRRIVSPPMAFPVLVTFCIGRRSARKTPLLPQRGTVLLGARTRSLHTSIFRLWTRLGSCQGCLLGRVL